MSILQRQFSLPPGLLLALVCALTVAVYWPGLGGPFLFDDDVHVAKNKEVAIEDLSLSSLRQAWSSSPFKFPASRPLSMLSFGVNHALTGFDTFWLKATNLGIHLVNGVLVFVVIRLIGRAAPRSGAAQPDGSRADAWALLTAALWLLHPMNLTSVLYTVQRMNSLSALFVLCATAVYLWGRLRTIDRGGRLWPAALGSLVLGGLGFLCKENALLLPAYLLIIEWLFLRFRAPTPSHRRELVVFFVAVALIPFLVGAFHVISDWDRLVGGYARRTFSVEERLLTEPRALWFYLKNLILPSYTELGLYHDGFGLSRSLLDPPSTLAAILGLAALLLTGLLLWRRAPVVSFGVLFYLAGHSMESSFIGLEPVFEHRNYLPGVGVLAAVAYGTLWAFHRLGLRLIRVAILSALVAVLAGTTALRAYDWRSEESFVLAEVAHHSRSTRANFQAGQLLITRLPESRDPQTTYKLARHFLEQVVALKKENADGLFGLIVLNLHAGKPPERQWIEELEHRLRTYPYSAENVSTSQFSYLVRWQMQVPEPRLTDEDMLGIFDAVLQNPSLDRFATAGIQSALRAYYDRVLNNKERALEHARQAVAAWPQNWTYHDRLIRILIGMGRLDDAQGALERARSHADTPRTAAEANRLRAEIAERRPLPAASTTTVSP